MTNYVVTFLPPLFVSSIVSRGLNIYTACDNATNFVANDQNRS